MVLLGVFVCAFSFFFKKTLFFFYTLATMLIFLDTTMVDRYPHWSDLVCGCNLYIVNKKMTVSTSLEVKTKHNYFVNKIRMYSRSILLQRFFFFIAEFAMQTRLVSVSSNHYHP